MQGIEMFDRVRILSSPLTDRLGFAEKLGLVYGITTPSDTGVEVVGGSGKDVALAVKLDDRDKTTWFDPTLVEFVDHAPGTTIRLSNRCYVRSPNGEWTEG